MFTSDFIWEASRYLSAAAGLLVLYYRLNSRRKLAPASVRDEPLISIIIPCRNEEGNLPILLESLKALKYTNFEVIVVNDDSSDRTEEIANAFRSEIESLQVVNTTPRPSGWTGKTWACATGARVCNGQYLLFTDADTAHFPDSLRFVIPFAENFDLISVPPFHRCELWWEKFLAGFHALPLIAGAYLQQAARNRLFAIGQYLLFSKASYDLIGGHRAVCNSLAEDIDLARIYIENDLRYGLYPRANVYQVQMYSSFRNFITGWIRILRLGIKGSSFRSVIEVGFAVNILCFCLCSGDVVLCALSIVAIFLVALKMRVFGKFTCGIGAFLLPLGVFLFAGLAVLACLQSLLGSRIVWKGRVYQT